MTHRQGFISYPRCPACAEMAQPGKAQDWKSCVRKDAGVRSVPGSVHTISPQSDTVRRGPIAERLAQRPKKAQLFLMLQDEENLPLGAHLFGVPMQTEAMHFLQYIAFNSKQIMDIVSRNKCLETKRSNRKCTTATEKCTRQLVPIARKNAKCHLSLQKTGRYTAVTASRSTGHREETDIELSEFNFIGLQNFIE